MVFLDTLAGNVSQLFGPIFFQPGIEDGFLYMSVNVELGFDLCKNSRMFGLRDIAYLFEKISYYLVVPF